MQSSDCHELHLKCDLNTLKCFGTKFWNESAVFQTSFATQVPDWHSKWMKNLFKYDSCRNLMIQRSNETNVCLTADKVTHALYLSKCERANYNQCWGSDMKNIGTWTYLNWNGEGIISFIHLSPINLY